MKLLNDFKKWMKLRRHEMDIRNFAIGMNSTIDVTKDLHVLFLDYDTKDELRIGDSIREIQLFWNLSHAFVYETKNGYHCIFFFDIMPYERCRMIIDYADGVDHMFKYVSRWYAHKTLRVVGKYNWRDIRFFDILPGSRLPTLREREFGIMKYREHCCLLSDDVIVEESSFEVNDEKNKITQW
jgi:hypothetical protein